MAPANSPPTNPPGPDPDRWVHPACRPLPIDRDGPFLALRDGRLLGATDEGVQISDDDGATWPVTYPGRHGQHPKEPGSFYLVQGDGDTLVMVFLDLADYTFAWNDASGEPEPGCRLELAAIRSLDGGRTWVERQTLLDGYNANFFGFIRTRTGRLVAVAEHLVPDPGRWVVCSFISDDDGAHWQRSNLVDLGGHGHHDGATEPTVAELADGRLLMLIRTNLDRFWQAWSDDGGRYWRTLAPSALDASSAPGHLLRLHSGRLALAWNRLHAQGGAPTRHAPGPAAEVPTSWFREELSLALSDDDGQTWGPPLVVARQRGGQLSYPHLFERRPGILWLTAGFAFRAGWQEPSPLRLQVGEGELLNAETARSA
jgi:hypothetical protein